MKAWRVQDGEDVEELRCEEAKELATRLLLTASVQASQDRALLEERLRIFYIQHLPAGSAHPDTRGAVSHFDGNVAALNEALREKYGVDLDSSGLKKAAAAAGEQ
jgi:hypothetical protein